jgi:hypothetical protein
MSIAVHWQPSFPFIAALTAKQQTPNKSLELTSTDIEKLQDRRRPPCGDKKI